MDYYQIAIGAVIGAVIVSYIWYRANEDDKEHQRNIRKAERVNKFEERIYTLENKMAGAQHRIEQLEKKSKR